MLANMTGIIELALEDEESSSIAGAMGNVMRHYNITFLDDKTTDWINLVQVMFGVYGTRIMANRMRRSTEKREAMQRAQEERSQDITRPASAPVQPSRQTVTVKQPGLPSVNVN